MPADRGEEVFEVVDEADRVVGLQTRATVHVEGLRHRAVYCLVFNTAGQLLMQRRSPSKKIGPNQWDLSIAEHLVPGETYRQAAVRGLREELGINCKAESLHGPLSPKHARKLEVVGQFCDSEFVECYRMVDFDAKLELDSEEVYDIRWVDLAQAKNGVAEQPCLYTQWFQDEMQRMKWLNGLCMQT